MLRKTTELRQRKLPKTCNLGNLIDGGIINLIKNYLKKVDGFSQLDEKCNGLISQLEKKKNTKGGRIIKSLTRNKIVDKKINNQNQPRQLKATKKKAKRQQQQQGRTN